MLIVNYEEFVREDSKLADKAKERAQDVKTRDIFFAGAKWCRDNLKGYAMELTTCGDCIFAHTLHGDLFCKRLRRSATPEIEINVNATDFCSFAIRRKVDV